MIPANRVKTPPDICPGRNRILVPLRPTSNFPSVLHHDRYGVPTRLKVIPGSPVGVAVTV